MVMGLASVLSACSTMPQGGGYLSYAGRGGVDRAPASAVPTVMRKLFAESSEEGTEWLGKYLAKEVGDGAALAARIRNGLSTMKPSEMHEDERLMKILARDINEVSEDEIKYLLEVASNRAVKLANCEESLIRRKEFLGYRKLIRERLTEAAGTDREARKSVVNFLKRMEVMLDKGMADPKKVNEFMAAVQAERFRGPQVSALTDTMQMMISSIGKDLDPKAAADIINSWPDTSLRGLRRFYSEVTMVQAAEGLDAEAAAEAVLRRMNVTDNEEIKVMKVCSLIRK
jgi:hypothetical protein